MTDKRISDLPIIEKPFDDGEIVVPVFQRHTSHPVRAIPMKQIIDFIERETKKRGIKMITTPDGFYFEKED